MLLTVVLENISDLFIFYELKKGKGHICCRRCLFSELFRSVYDVVSQACDFWMLFGLLCQVCVPCGNWLSFFSFTLILTLFLLLFCHIA